MAISTAVDASAVARVMGIETKFKDLRANNTVNLPQRIAIVAQGTTLGSYDLAKKQITSAFEAGSTYGFGSPIHLIASQLLPVNGDGVGSIPVTVYPLEDDGAGVAAVGDITPTGTATEAGTLRVIVNNIRSEGIVVAIDDTVADLTAAIKVAIDSVLEIPVTTVDNTTDVELAAKWMGTTGNGLFIEIEGTVAGLTFAITQPVTGANSPDVDPALALMGNVWETLVINGASDSSDTVTLDKFKVFGEGRWEALVNKPLIVFTGNTSETVSAAITTTDARKTDRINAQLVSPACTDLGMVVAARQLARIAVTANNNPPLEYANLEATGLTPATDDKQWTYTERDQAVKGGSSTSQVKNGVVVLSDTITFYHPDGDPTPAYRYVVDIIRVMNITFNMALAFVDWDGKILIPDDQPTLNPDARTPKAAVANAASVIDGLGLNAIISDPDTAKASIQAEIDSENPNRLNVAYTVQLSGNANITSITQNFGFYFGS